MRQIYLLILFSIAMTSSLYAAGKVSISGKVRAYREYPFKSEKDEVSVTAYDPYVRVYKAQVDAEGNFKLTFPKAFTGDVEFRFADHTAIQVMVSPGDRQYYVVEPIAINTVVSFSGDNAATNQQMAHYVKDRTEVWTEDGRKQRPFTMAGRRSAELEYPGTLERKKAFLESYIKDRQLSTLFIQWARADIDYNYAARIFHIKTNEHSPISDPAFFKQFPLDDARSLVASSYLNYLYEVRSSAIYWSPQVNTLIVYGTDINYDQVYHGLRFKDREVYDQMLKYSSLDHKSILAYLSKPDSVRKYTMPQEDRFAVGYINRKTSGVVRDFYFANYMLRALERASEKAPIEYRYPRLLAAYKKSVADRKYTKILEEAYVKFKAERELKE